MVYMVNEKKFTNYEEAKKYEEEVNAKNRNKAKKVDELENKIKELEQKAEKVQEIINQHKSNLDKIHKEIANVESDLLALTVSKTDYKAIEEFFKLFI